MNADDETNAWAMVDDSINQRHLCNELDGCDIRAFIDNQIVPSMIKLCGPDNVQFAHLMRKRKAMQLMRARKFRRFVALAAEAGRIEPDFTEPFPPVFVSREPMINESLSHAHGVLHSMAESVHFVQYSLNEFLNQLIAVGCEMHRCTEYEKQIRGIADCVTHDIIIFFRHIAIERRVDELAIELEETDGDMDEFLALVGTATVFNTQDFLLSIFGVQFLSGRDSEPFINIDFSSVETLSALVDLITTKRSDPLLCALFPEFSAVSRTQFIVQLVRDISQKYKLLFASDNTSFSDCMDIVAGGSELATKLCERAIILCTLSMRGIIDIEKSVSNVSRIWDQSVKLRPIIQCTAERWVLSMKRNMYHGSPIAVALVLLRDSNCQSNPAGAPSISSGSSQTVLGKRLAPFCESDTEILSRHSEYTWDE